MYYCVTKQCNKYKRYTIHVVTQKHIPLYTVNNLAFRLRVYMIITYKILLPYYKPRRQGFYLQKCKTPDVLFRLGPDI